MTRLLIDAHLDLAMNLTYYDRDITLSLEAMNQAEAHMTDVRFRNRATVTLPEMRRARIGVCIATLIARSGPQHARATAYRRADIDHATRGGAFAACHAQLGYYHLLQSQGEIRLIQSRRQLDEHWKRWQSARPDEQLPIGVILSMEGADPIIHPEQAEYWWSLGLRAIGPAHYGFSHYAAGTRTDGPLTDAGRTLLKQMQRLGIALDVTHLADQSMAEAFELYEGPIWASHHNCRALVDWDRQLTDEQIRRLIERDAVIGAAFDAVMLSPGWVIGKSSPEVLDLTSVVDHIDHICQMAGNTRHVGIGTDLDGGYGTEQTPRDLKSIYDVHKLVPILEQRGYRSTDIDALFHGNWLRKFREALPEGD